MPRTRRTTVAHRLEYAAGRAAQALICSLPLSWARETGAALGAFVFSGLGIRRAVVMEHLERIFGEERTDRELLTIARDSYANFGRMTFEYMWFPRMTRRRVESLIRVTGAEHLDTALAAGKGAVLVSGHFGNWEVLATLASRGYPMTLVVGEQHNILVDGLMNRLRARFGAELVPVTGSLKGVLRALRDNRVVCLLSDQDAGRKGTFVEFLGAPASTPYGPARFAARTGAALLPAVVLRHEDGNNEIIVCPPVPVPPAGSPKEERVRALTQGYTSAFEEFIRRYPEQYFWMHRRWKTRPPESR
jgi:KDO2-lipid IV(A) lauroyltransferase